MATIQQIEANRRNALKSTGPRTPEGKAAVRLNSLRHGLRARTMLIPGESRDEFQSLCDDLEAEWNPQSMSEQFYLEQMLVSQWKLMRMEVGEVNLFRNAPKAGIQVPLLDRLWRAQARLERSYARAQRELERLQTSRHQRTQEDQPQEPAPAPQPAAEARPAAVPPEPKHRRPEPNLAVAPVAAAPSPQLEPDRRAAS